jgi:hypothetical protein
MKTPEPDWRWGTPEGSREFDRLMDGLLSFREKIQWIEEIETLHERFAEGRVKRLCEENAGRTAKG